jgi:uncharacterized protein YndB with AHSA1/START domain
MAEKIQKQIELKASPARVWRALTNHKEFGEWFRVRLEGPFVPGKTVEGNITYPGYEHVKWKAVVETMDTEKLFSFRWHPYAVDPKVDYSKESPTLVEFHLQKTKGGTLLTITESGFENVPSNRRSEAFRMNDMGWAEQTKNIEEYVVEKP